MNIVGATDALAGSVPGPARMAATDGSSSTRWISSELGARVASAIVLGIIALAVTYLGGPAFKLFWLLAGIAVLLEWLAITGVAPRRPLQFALGGGLVVLTVLALAQASLTVFAGAVGLICLVGLALARGGRDRLWAVAGFFYSAVISLVPPAVRDDPENGLVGLFWMFAVVWATDIAAYFTGRRLGGPKLWPQVSPKKTWSGFLGGLIAGTLGGLVVVTLLARSGESLPTGWAPVLLASAAASVASQLGDLGESALKRRFDVKDSGHLIPGHGGAMDRLDGFFAVAAGVGAVLLAARLGLGPVR
jgi:phosphatidate cytidylyltransferase